MKQGFLSLFGKRWKFQKSGLAESGVDLKNPARGWYQVHTFSVEEDCRTDELEWRCTGEDTLALVLMDLGAYKDRDLDEAALANVERILLFFVDKELDLILRFSYDHEGKALEREPFFFSQVTAHVDQLGPLLTKYAPHIFVYQGLLVGNWGEMHASRFLDIKKLNQLAFLLNGYLGDEVYMAVRRPSCWRSLHPQCCGKESYQGIFMGLFDDAIFGSDTHLGTFGVSKEAEAGWESAWSPEEEIAFEEKLGNHAPQGGEALYEEQAAEDRTLAETVERLRRMRVSYLNRGHDVRLLEYWKELTWTEEGPYLGMSGYDYIGRHMGYRFCVRNVSAQFFRGHEEACVFKIVIENVGFSRCYHETKVWLEWETESAARRQELDLDLCSILPGEKGIGSCRFPPVPGAVYVCAERKKDKVPIHFANAQEDTRRILLGTWRKMR